MKIPNPTHHRIVAAFFGAVLFACTSQLTVANTDTYTIQTGNFNAQQQRIPSGGAAGAYNDQSYEVGLYANGGSGGTNETAFETFSTTGTTAGSARPLQVGDSFSITMYAPNPFGFAGIYFDENTNYSTYSNYNATERTGVVLGPSGDWMIQNNGTSVDTGIGGSISITAALSITSSNTFNTTITNNNTTTSTTYYDLVMQNAPGSTDKIQSFALAVQNDNGNFYVKNGSLTNTGSVTIGGSNLSLAISGVITDGLDSASTSTNSPNSVTKIGIGIFTLSNASNSFSGGLNLNAGTLSSTAQGALGSGGFSFNTGTLSIDTNAQTYSNNITLAGGGITGGTISATTANGTFNGTVSLGTNRLIVTGSNNTTLGGAIGGTGDLLKQGSGTLSVNAAANSWSANNTGTNGTNTNTALFIDQGTVQIGATGALGTTDGSTTNRVALGSSSTAGLTSSLLISAGGVTVANPIDARYFTGLSLGTGTTTGAETVGGSNTSGTATYSGNITLHNSLNLVAATGGTVAFTGPIAAGTGGSPYANEVLNGTPGLAIGGGGNNGTISFSGSSANTYTGTTTVNSGELDLNKTGVQAMGGNLTISGGTVVWNQSNQLATSAMVSMSSGMLNLNGQSQTVVDMTNTGGTFMTGAGTWTGTGASMTWGGGTNTVNTGGTIYDNHLTVTAGTNEVQANGLVQLSLTGLTMNGGTITLDSDATNPGTLSLMSNVNANDGTTSNINSSSPTNPGVVKLNGAARTFTVGSSNAATTLNVSASIQGTGGALIKAGPGALVLTGNNTYTGATTINTNGGTLNAGAAGALGATSSVTVNSGGTLLLSGSGNLNRVNDSAGISLGTTSGAAATLARTGTASEGTGAHTTNGGISSTGTNAVGLGALTLNSNSNLDFGTGGVGTLVFASFTPNAHVLNILNYTSTAAGPLVSGTDGVDDRLIFDQDQSANLADFNFGGGITAIEIALGGGFFEITAVPEPSTWLGAGLALATMLVSQRRRLVRSRK